MKKQYLANDDAQKIKLLLLSGSKDNVFLAKNLIKSFRSSQRSFFKKHFPNIYLVKRFATFGGKASVNFDFFSRPKIDFGFYFLQIFLAKSALFKHQIAASKLGDPMKLATNFLNEILAIRSISMLDFSLDSFGSDGIDTAFYYNLYNFASDQRPDIPMLV